MIKIPAAYFDGTSARRRCIELTLDDEGFVRIDGDGVHHAWPYAEVRIGARLGNTPRQLYLPDGGKCEIEDNDAVDEVVARREGSFARGWVHRMESRWPYVMLTVLLAFGIGWATVEFVVPWAAMRIAYVIPPAMEWEMGQEGLETLDEVLFEPSELPAPEQARVHALFESMSRQLRRGVSDSGIDPHTMEQPHRLALRSSPAIGANAFALPGGIVVVTDELVELAGDDDELVAVMAHEMGHQAHRHVLRGLLQSSMTALLIAVVLGDLSSITSLSATLPTYLADAKYSREFELEADRYAARFLDATGRPRTALSRILRRLTQDRDEREESVFDYLSSHPSTPERVEALQRP